MRKLTSIISICLINQNLLAAEAGMPQLDPEFWFSQGFWLILIFTIIYLSISKFFIPKIKDTLDSRDNKIKKDLEEAKNFKNLSEKKIVEYEKNLNEAKKEINKILSDSKKKLDNDIKNKKNIIEKEIESEIIKAKKEIFDLKSNSAVSINKISKEVTAEIIENLTGNNLNESSIEAVVNETSKKHLKNIL